MNSSFSGTWVSKNTMEAALFGRFFGMPGYQRLADEYGARGLVVIGFKFDNMPDTEDPLEFTRGIGVHYPLALATDNLKEKFGGIEGLPTTMLYDRRGVLRMKVIGFEYMDNIKSALKPLL